MRAEATPIHPYVVVYCWLSSWGGQKRLVQCNQQDNCHLLALSSGRIAVNVFKGKNDNDQTNQATDQACIVILVGLSCSAFKQFGVAAEWLLSPGVSL